jgi:spermidine synthase
MKNLQWMKGLTDNLQVTREGNIVTLWSSGGVRHTVLHLDAPHSPGLEYARNSLLALIFRPEARSLLMLGLGGGAIIHMLRAVRPDLGIDAVEIDPAVIALARKFFHVWTSPHFQIFLDDAASYLPACDKQYDIVILDVYCGDVFPARCATREFFEDVRRRLGDAGVMVVNWMRGNHEAYRRVISDIEACFGRVWILHGIQSKNSLFFAPVRDFDRQDLLEAAARLEITLPFESALVQLAHRLSATRKYPGVSGRLSVAGPACRR